ncbi:MAG: serine/threonine protein kinase, partial [Gemmataceae bacterium]|nr:serine/threonine protein kinase [Gemmataceae bacterium]
MPTESDKHAASLAVSRFGADRARVKQAFQSVVQAQAQGRPADLLETLVDKQLLTSDQARELRLALEVTRLDAGAPGTGGPTNPQQFATPAGGGATMPREHGDPGRPGSGYDPRSLGEFRILRRLGEGGMGSVYLAYHEEQRRHVTIKVLADHLASNQAYIDRFYREARSVALLDHPNIVRSITAGQDPANGKQYLVLEYVDGPSAHYLLEQFGKLAVGDAVHIILDIARALEHAHSRNIVHRDIKPDNILLTQSGVAKLADLGLAKRTDEASHLTAARQGFGTPYYMPYEQAMNAKFADGRSDIFALGATLYHLLTAEVPFPGNSHLEIVEKKDIGTYPPARSINPDVPEALERILAKMLARQPDDRYQTASELIVDLERSKLTAPVPSFVDPDLALQDPLVRARLTSPAPPTRPDLEASTNEPPSGNGNPNVWYLRYRNREGRWCKTRATTQQIVQGLRDGRIAGTVEAGHQPQGEFRPLTAYSEFGATAGAPVARPKPKRPR